MKLNDRLYNILKWLCMIVLPAAATFYAALAAVWALPYSREIVTTVTAAAAFIGALLGISTAEYRKEEQHESV